MAACGSKKKDPKVLTIKVYKAGYGDTFVHAWKEDFENMYAEEGYKIEIEESNVNMTGAPFERMMNTDSPNYVGGNKEGFRNPSKYMVYNDPFFGWFDTQVKENVDKQYRSFARRFTLYAKQSEEFGYIYDVLAKLCRLLSYKYDLGVRVRAAYQGGDRVALQAVVADFKKTERAAEAFYKAFRVLWHKENKPHGFEVQDLRLGGLLQRLKHCRERLEAYLRGEEETLPELEEVLLDFWGRGLDYCKDTPCYPDWGLIVTANQLR